MDLLLLPAPPTHASIEEMRRQQDFEEWVAVRHGLPPRGHTLINRHGIQWAVDGHLCAPGWASYVREGGMFQCQDITQANPEDFMPSLVPLNFSKKLLSFFVQIDRATSKHLMFLDTMPDLRPRMAKSNMHWVSLNRDPARFLIHLDADRANEPALFMKVFHYVRLWVQVRFGDPFLGTL